MERPEPEDRATGQKKRQFPFAWPMVLLVSYFLLLAATGYFAFLQREYNPQSILTEKQQEYIEGDNEALRNFVIESLNADGAAFKARRELAVQSFNVVLGAILGFLSASSVSGRNGRSRHLTRR